MQVPGVGTLEWNQCEDAGNLASILWLIDPINIVIGNVVIYFIYALVECKLLEVNMAMSIPKRGSVFMICDIVLLLNRISPTSFHGASPLVFFSICLSAQMSSLPDPSLTFLHIVFFY